MNNKRPIRVLMLATMLGLASSGWASVDNSSKPGGIYKLKPGIYVADGAECESPANAVIRQYDGRGISTAHSRACKAKLRARKGKRFTVDQTCIDSGVGPGRPVVQRQQVVVHDALHFTQTIDAGSTSYRYCPEYQLPPELRRALR